MHFDSYLRVSLDVLSNWVIVLRIVVNINMVLETDPINRTIIGYHLRNKLVDLVRFSFINACHWRMFIVVVEQLNTGVSCSSCFKCFANVVINCTPRTRFDELVSTVRYCFVHYVIRKWLVVALPRHYSCDILDHKFLEFSRIGLSSDELRVVVARRAPNQVVRSHRQIVIFSEGN